MKLHKMMFLTSMVMGTMVAISSYSWLSMWMGMEINLLSIIPLMAKNKNIFASESSMKYFITQAVASLILLMSVIMMLILSEFIAPQMNSCFSMIMNSALLTKLGAAPFHFWFPEVMEGLSWMNCLILLTWQKIAPMAIIMNNKMEQNFIVAIIIMCSATSMIMAMNQISLRKLMAFSSINHIAWMLASTLISVSTWTIYFMIYCFMNISIVMTFKLNNVFYIKQMYAMMEKNKMMKLAFMLNFLSLGGLPPFIGFLPKWIVINWMSNNEMFLMAFLMITMSLIMLFIYVRLMVSSMMLETQEPKNQYKSKNNNKILITTYFISMTGLMGSTMVFSLI